MRPIEYTALFAFCGLGAGARGFLDAQVTMFGRPARFRSIGGIDNDAAACADFEYLTDSPALCADIATLQAHELRAFAGAEAPDCVFLSAPCKGFSGLLSAKAAKAPRYEALNQLAVKWMRVMLEAWPTPPRLVLFENVPRIASRGRALLAEIRKLLRAAGYLFHADTHDCGELGGLAQRRNRFLLVARHPGRAAPLLYQPTKLRVRACGEVIGPMPMPEDPAGGAMHALPRISWLNWVRLALIPAGGDWRDLEGVLADGQPRREVHRRHRVETWSEPSATIAGSGSNAVGAVADPRLTCSPRAGAYGVLPFGKPSKTVIGKTSIDHGPFTVADPRFVPQAGNLNLHWGKYRAGHFDAPAQTVIGATRVGSGAQSVADPRPFGNVDRVTPWSEPVGTITHAPAPSSGGAVADIRVKVAYDHGYGVLHWDEPSPTVAGGSAVGQGAYSVAEVRSVGSTHRGTFGVMSWSEAAGTITGNARVCSGRFSVADPRKAPPSPMVIIAADNTWHRPLTTLELAALQDIPWRWKGKPLALSGSSASKHRERIGNAVPVGAGRRIGEQMLVCLVASDVEGFALSSGGAVWVDSDDNEQWARIQ